MEKIKMFFKKIKGFTLIELLAVIIVLVIIILIAMPIILHVIESARKNAFLRTGAMILKAGEIYSLSPGEEANRLYELVDPREIPFARGNLKTGELMYDNNGNQAMAIWDGRYCIVKEFEGEVVIVDDDTGEYCNIETLLAGEDPNGGDGGIGAPRITGYLCSNPPGDLEITPEHFFTFNQVSRTITGYSTAGPKDLVIPCTIGGANVEIISNNAFQNMSLTSVIMPDTILTIGVRAFYNNQIHTLELGNNVTYINYEAFRQNLITELVIPDSVVTLYGYRTQYSSYYGPFYNNRIASLTIGSGLKNITFSTFRSNRLTEVVIPENVEQIGESAFASNLLTKVTIGTGNSMVIGTGAFTSNQITELTINSMIVNIGATAFQGNLITDLIISGTITGIGNDAFKNNQLSDSEAFIRGRNSDGSETTTLVSYGGANRSNIVIPNDIVSLAGASFNSLGLSGTIVIGNGITAIEDNKFQSNALSNVLIGNSVQTIGVRSFYANQITNLDLGNSVTYINYEAFRQNLITELVIPDSVVTLYGYRTQYSSYYGPFYNNRIASLTIGSGLKNITFSTFRSNRLTEVVIPENVEQIGESAFASNSDLSLIFIRGKVDATNFTSLGTSWNGTCTNIIYELASCYDYSGNTITNYHAICGGNVMIPSALGGNSITTISDSAFVNKSLTRVVIPSTVSTIGNNAFSGNSINPIVVMGKSSSGGFSSLGSNWNDGAYVIYENDNETCFKITSNTVNGYYNESVCPKNITIPGYITTIANSAFANNSLNSVIIPSSVTTIGNTPFSGNVLSSVTVSEGIKFVSLGTSWYGNVHKVSFLGDAYEKNCFGVTGNTITSYPIYCHEHVVIPTSVEGVSINSIGANAFKSKAIRFVTLGSHIITVGSNAFEANNIAWVSMDEGLEEIGYRAFYNTGLEEAILPASLRIIGADAFASNSNLGLIEVLGKNDASDFESLGSNWNGSCSNIIYMGN